MLIAHPNMTFLCLIDPKRVGFLNMALAKSNFEGSKSVCHFYQYGPTLCDGVLDTRNFGAPIDHFIRLKTKFYANNIFKNDLFHFFFPQLSWFSEFGSCQFKLLKDQCPCAIFISMGQLYLMVYCIL